MKRNAYFVRVKVPRLVENRGQLVAPARERYIPRAEAGNTAIAELVRDRLRPPAERQSSAGWAARSRAELHSAIVHQPTRGAARDVPSL